LVGQIHPPVQSKVSVKTVMFLLTNPLKVGIIYVSFERKRKRNREWKATNRTTDILSGKATQNLRTRWDWASESDNRPITW
jgi:ssRNA-specific RNase YbeY (16S rRNA maturation enzyme)